MESTWVNLLNHYVPTSLKFLWFQIILGAKLFDVPEKYKPDTWQEPENMMIINVIQVQVR